MVFELFEEAAPILAKSEAVEPLLAEAAAAGAKISAAAGKALEGLTVGARKEAGYLAVTKLLRAAKDGSSDSLFVLAEDNKSYLAKFLGGGQGDLIPAHEWLSTKVCNYFKLRTPESGILNFSSDFVRANRADLPASFRPGPAFGSRDLGSVIDELDESQFRLVRGRSAFGAKGMVVDGLLRNTDHPQVLFTEAEDGVSYIPHRIDFGWTFGGPKQDDVLHTIHLYGVDPGFYHKLTEPVLEEEIDRLLDMPNSVLTEPLKALPKEWLSNGKGAKLSDAVKSVLHHRDQVPSLIARTIKTDPEWLPRVGY